MKRDNIKNTTIYIIVFCIVIFLIMWIFTPSRDAVEPSEEEGNPGIRWSDTISNKASVFIDADAMDRDVERFMSRWNIKGMSIAVSRNDSLLYAKGFGYSDLEARRPMEAHSIMRIASASKLITAAAVMKLVEQGKLNLHSPVFGPEGILNDRDITESIKDPRIRDITVEHLLRHEGGFTLRAGDPMFNTAEIIKAKHLAKAPDNHELIRIVVGRRLGFMPGSGRRYSNFGYMVLSKVIEKVSGLSYWDYVKKDLLEPAGCTAFQPATNYYEERHPNEVKYYAPDDELIEEYNGSGKMVTRCYGGANFNGLMGAGGWVTSAADLNRFVASIDGLPGLKDVLRSGSIKAMTSADEDVKSCFGWTSVDSKGKWMRSGTLASAHALIIKFPDNECWVVTTNTGVWTGFHFTRDIERLIERLRNKYSELLPRRNLFK